MRRSLFGLVLLLTISLLLAGCGAASAGPMTWLDRPLDGASLPLAPITIQAHASDDHGVASFEFFVDDDPLVTASADGGRLGMAMVEWDPTTPGTYTIRARGVDNQGNLGSDAASVITVGDLPQASPTLPPPPKETPSGPPPEVAISFTADRTNLLRGECAMLMWTVEGGEAGLLNGEEVPLSGEREVCPPATIQYVLAVYVGEGPPSPPVAERELVIAVGEPEATTLPPTPAVPTATMVPPAPTPTPLAPPPTIVSFQANPASITDGQTTVLSWAVEGVISAVYFDGEGVGDHDSRARRPTQTTTYTLRAVGPGGESTRDVTVTVAPAVFSADLAITDLYPETNYGPVWTRITNNGPGTVKNVTVQLSCQWAFVDPIEGTTVNTDQRGPMPISIGSLTPGQTKAFNIDIDVVPEYRCDMTCTIQVPFTDPNPGNNTYFEQMP